ncbi:MAG: DinB family protein [Blastocatellia bacterium]|nr:DinB family protein [Blastocatellia bacterium]
MSDSVMSADELAARLEAAADTLLTEVANLPSDLIVWKPADEAWSVMEILCHVAEFVPYWTGQTLQIVQQPGEPWGRTHTDTARLEAVQQAGSHSLSEVMTVIRDGVQKSAATLCGLNQRDLSSEAMSRNPRWARQPASFIVEHLLIEHVEKHRSQVQRNVQQFHEREVAA